MNNTLKKHAHSLRLSGLLESLDLRLQEAEANRLPYAQFLELLFQDEINVRHQRLFNRRYKLADFRETRLLDHFDFSFNPGINRAQIYELATGHFVSQRRDVLPLRAQRTDRDAQDLLGQRLFDVALLDLRLGRESGLDVVASPPPK